MTGWRVGYAIASDELIDAIKKVHDFVTVRAPHPLQIACTKDLSFPESYYKNLKANYNEKRLLLLSSLEQIGLRCIKPRGAYYIWSDFSELDKKSSDTEFALRLVKKV